MSLFRPFVILALSCFMVPAAVAETPVGTWLTEEGKSRIEISRCGEELCGRIVWLREPNEPDGSPKLDDENPDPQLRDRPILGLQILSGFTRASEDGTEWEDGTIYNPENGKTYSCTIAVREDGTLRVRGYVGIPLLGETQIWQRVESTAGD